MSILISGSLAFDRIMNFPGLYKDNFVAEKLHNINVSFLIDDLKEHFGGTAGNISYNLAMLGMTPTIIAKAGTDFGVYKDWLDSKGVDTSQIQYSTELKTGVGTVMTDQANNQIWSFYAGAMGEPYQVNPGQIEGAQLAIISPSNPEEMIQLPEIYREAGIPFIFDPSQQLPRLTGDDLKQCLTGSYALTCNDYELSIIKKRTNLFEDELLQLTQMLVVTLGEQGCEIRLREGQKVTVPAAPVSEVKDPTGAGDAFRAGLIYGVVKQWDLKTIAQFAGVVAAYAVEHHGTQAHAFSFQDVATRYESVFGPMPQQ